MAAAPRARGERLAFEVEERTELVRVLLSRLPLLPTRAYDCEWPVSRLCLPPRPPRPLQLLLPDLHLHLLHLLLLLR